jgi:hypothetical protein
VKRILKTAVLGPAFVLMLVGDLPTEAPRHVRFVREAHAIFGVWRRTARRTVIVGSAAAAGAAAAESSAAAQQAAAAQPPSAAAAPPPPPAATAPPAPAAGTPLPIGTVVSVLPAGCISTPSGGVDYFYCGGNFYRAAFQGNNLVYVTAKP